MLIRLVAALPSTSKVEVLAAWQAPQGSNRLLRALPILWRDPAEEDRMCVLPDATVAATACSSP